MPLDPEIESILQGIDNREGGIDFFSRLSKALSKVYLELDPPNLAENQTLEKLLLNVSLFAVRLGITPGIAILHPLLEIATGNRSEIVSISIFPHARSSYTTNFEAYCPQDLTMSRVRKAVEDLGNESLRTPLLGVLSKVSNWGQFVESVFDNKSLNELRLSGSDSIQARILPVRPLMKVEPTQSNEGVLTRFERLTAKDSLDD